MNRYTPRQMRELAPEVPETDDADRIYRLEAERNLLRRYAGTGGQRLLAKRIDEIDDQISMLTGLPLEPEAVAKVRGVAERRKR